jgi:hypothetical protein
VIELADATLAEIRAGLGQIAVRVSDDPVMVRCCRIIDEALATQAKSSADATNRVLVEAETEVRRLRGLINHPEIEAFLRAVHIEAVHQVVRWGTSHDRAKRPADWFWLIGYLAGKALHAAVAGNVEKAKHHCISTAAALYNWHCAISGADVRMCPGRSDLAELVESTFPGETGEASTAVSRA